MGTHNEHTPSRRAKGQSADTTTEITQVLEPNQHFNATIIKMLQQATTNTPGTNGGKRSLSKETKDDQMGISELKNIKTEIKKKTLKRWVQQQVEKRKESVNCKTEYKIPNLSKMEKYAMKKINRASRTCGTITKDLVSNSHGIRVLEGENKESKA